MLDDAQASEESAIKELRALYDLRGTRLSAILYAMTIDGARDIIETACKHQGKDATKIIASLGADSMIEIAAQLVGHDPDVLKQESRRGE
jgi:hypothetical protein